MPPDLQISHQGMSTEYHDQWICASQSVSPRFWSSSAKGTHSVDKLGLAEGLERGLGLDFPPIALARVAQRPNCVDEWKEPVPSACTLWRRAEIQVFFAGPEVHMGCPIGAMVMGFELPSEKQQELMGLVGDMCAVAYIEEDEVELIPSFGKGTSGVVYGPLTEFPLNPELVIVWATPRQAMILDEAVGVTHWTGESATVLGRPSCAALPASEQGNTASMSLGCIGMRTFTEVPDTHSLIAIAAEIAEDLESALQTTLSANEHMEAAYKQMKAAVR